MCLAHNGRSCTGAQLLDILDANPGCKGILFDQPGVVAIGIPDPRIEAVAGSFFDHIPAGADAYLLRASLQCWSTQEQRRRNV
jgi:hypothetical protein